MRLDKFIMNTLKMSRTDAKKIIKKKLIFVNEKLETSSDYNVLDSDIVMYKDNEDNRVLTYKENVYIMMNKPQGYVCATKKKKKKTVLDLIEEYVPEPIETPVTISLEERIEALEAVMLEVIGNV